MQDIREKIEELILREGLTLMKRGCFDSKMKTDRSKFCCCLHFGEGSEGGHIIKNGEIF